MQRNLVSDRIHRVLPYLTLFVEVLIFYRYILTGKSVFPWDIRTYHLPQALFAAQSLRDGELPLWNPFIYCGHPFAANIQAAFFYPPRLIATLLGGVSAGRMLYSLELELILHVFLAGSFCFLLMRELGISRGAALAGATSFQLGAFFTSQTEHLGAMEAAAWLPLIWLLILRSARQFTWRSALLLCGALSMSLLSGFTPLTTVTLLSSAILIFFLIATRKASLRLIGLLIVGFAASLLLCAIVFFPAVQLTLLSVSRFRSDWIGNGGGLPLQSLSSLFWPDSFGVLDRGRYHGSYEITFMYLYSGVVSLAGALLLVITRRAKAALPFLLLFVLSALFMLGQSTPFGSLYPFVFPALLRGVIYPQEWIAPFSLSLCILGAYGIAAYTKRTYLSVLVIALAICDLTWFGSNRPFNSVDPAAEPGVTETTFEGSGELLNTVRQFSQKTQPPSRIDTVNDSIDWVGSAMITRVPTAGGEDPLALARYIQARLAFVNGQRWGYYYQVDNVASPVLPALNICCLLTRTRLPESQLTKSAYSKMTEVPGGYLYSTDAALPRFHLVHQVADGATAVENLPSASTLRPSLDDTKDQVTVRSYRRNSVALETRSAHPAFLVSSEANYPGWRATVDGHETPIYYTNIAFRGIEVPAGRHSIEFQFAPRLFTASAIISVLAWLSWLTLLIYGWRR